MFKVAVRDQADKQLGHGALVPDEVVAARAHYFRVIQENGQRNLHLARRLMAMRNSRETQFGAGLFSDPAWDILLTLYVSKVQQARVKVTAIIEGSGVPSTTALRWISTLAERGYIVKFSNPTDARSTLIEMSDAAAVLMTDFLESFENNLVRGSSASPN